MMTETQRESTVSQSVAVMVRYQEDRKYRPCRDRMIAEIQAIAGWVRQAGMDPITTDSLVLQPVGDRLLAVCGSEVGPRLYSEFLRAFYDLDDVGRGNGLSSS